MFCTALTLPPSVGRAPAAVTPPFPLAASFRFRGLVSVAFRSGRLSRRPLPRGRYWSLPRRAADRTRAREGAGVSAVLAGGVGRQPTPGRRAAWAGGVTPPVCW